MTKPNVKKKCSCLLVNKKIHGGFESGDKTVVLGEHGVEEIGGHFALVHVKNGVVHGESLNSLSLDCNLGVMSCEEIRTEKRGGHR